MEQRIGTCSICGGDVVGWEGAWFGVVPPPPPHCSNCGSKMISDVIPMVHKPSSLSEPEK